MESRQKQCPKKEKLWTGEFTANFYRSFRGKLTAMLLKLLHRTEWEEHYHTLSVKPVLSYNVAHSDNT